MPGKWCLCLLLICGTTFAEEELKFRPLWDGKSFNGWREIPGGSWKIEEGAIVGRNEKADARHGHLATVQEYGDFTIRLKFKSLKGNSGLYFRVAEVPGNVSVKGFQAEIDARNDIGGLYETHGRAWVVQPKPAEVAKYFKPDDWNTMEVAARGGDVSVRVNGTQTAALKNDPGRKTGFFALQLHGSQDVEVSFKDIEIAGEPLEKK